LPDPRRSDEVGLLAATLNRMLGSLERAREGERRFLADASHELRTPLTALHGNVEYLARHGASPELIADLEDDAGPPAPLAARPPGRRLGGRPGGGARPARGGGGRPGRGPPPVSPPTTSPPTPSGGSSWPRSRRSSAPCRPSSRTRAGTAPPAAASRSPCRPT